MKEDEEEISLDETLLVSEPGRVQKVGASLHVVAGFLLLISLATLVPNLRVWNMVDSGGLRFYYHFFVGMTLAVFGLVCCVMLWMRKRPGHLLTSGYFGYNLLGVVLGLIQAVRTLSDTRDFYWLLGPLFNLLLICTMTILIQRDVMRQTFSVSWKQFTTAIGLGAFVHILSEITEILIQA